MKYLLLSLATCLLLRAKAQVVPASGLVAGFNFTNGSLVNEVPENAITLTGTSMLTDDRFGLLSNAMAFNGTSTYLNAGSGNSNGLGITGTSISISFWYKTSSTAYAGFIDNSAVSNAYGIDNYNGFFRFLGGGNFSSPIFSADNRWHHIAFTKNGTKGIFFKDGIALDSTNTMTNITASSGSQNLVIGRRNNNTSYFSGSLDDIAIYNRTLTKEEVKQIYSYNGFGVATNTGANFNTSTVLPPVTGIIYGGVVGPNISSINYTFNRTILGNCIDDNGYSMALSVVYTGTGSNSIVDYEWSIKNGDVLTPIANTAGQSAITVSGIMASMAGKSIQVKLTGRIIYNGLGQYTDNYVYPSQGIAALPFIVAQSPTVVGICTNDFGILPSVYLNAGGNNLRYSWYKDGILNADPLGDGLAYATITGYGNGFLANGSIYKIKAENYCGSVTSAGIALSNAPAPTATLLSNVYCDNTNQLLPFTATGYKLGSAIWYKDGTSVASISSQYFPDLVYGNVYKDDIGGLTSGQYKVVVTDGCGVSVSASGANLLVTSVPEIYSSPGAQRICSGTNATFTVSATGSDLSYQWYLNGNNPIEGNNSNVLEQTYDYITSLKNAGYPALYHVRVSNDCGNASTSQVEATPLLTPGILNDIPSAYAACRGSNIILLSVFQNHGAANENYTWWINGVQSPDLTVLGLNFVMDDAHVGSYVGIAFNACGTVTSGVGILSYADTKIEFDSKTVSGVTLGSTISIAPNVVENVESVDWYVNTGSGFTLITNPEIEYCGYFPCTGNGPCIRVPMPCTEQSSANSHYYLNPDYSLLVRTVNGSDLEAEFKFVGHGVCDSNFETAVDGIKISTGVVNGVEDETVNALSDFKLYPNPVTSKVYFEYNYGLSDKIYRIFNVHGVTLYEGNAIEGVNNIEISLLKGVYLFKMGALTRKLIVE